MTWETRLKDASYTSPSGQIISFLYEDVSTTVDKNTAAFSFPDADGTYVQDLGKSNRKFPLRIYFSGANYDRDADAFEAALLERGQGSLSHPMYGVKRVVPFGTLSRRDDLVSAANQAVFDVVFWETIKLIYPTAQDDPISRVLTAVDEFNLDSAAQFGESIDQSTAGDTVNFKAEFGRLLGASKNALDKIAEGQENVQTAFDTTYNSLISNLDDLVGRPVDLATQTAIMLQAPARAQVDIRGRLDRYKRIIDTIVLGGVPPETNYDNSDTNGFYSRDQFAMTCVTGQVLSAVNAQFETRGGALEAAEAILTTFDSVVAWRDDNYDQLTLLDTGEAYRQLQEVVAIGAGALTEISFSLAQERIVILDRARTIIDLAAELYGEVDSRLDFIIESNNLGGVELLELPAGREIRYYV